MAASSSAAAAARAVLNVGAPGLQPGCRPMTTYSAESGTRPDFRARSTISGPMPAQSPSVIPMRGSIAHLQQVRAPSQADENIGCDGLDHIAPITCEKKQKYKKECGGRTGEDEKNRPHV